MKVNRSQLTDIMPYTLSTIDNFRRKGMPGDGTTFDTKDCIKWLLEDKLEEQRKKLVPESSGAPKDSLKALTERKLRAETEAAEIETAKKKETVVLVEDSVTALKDIVTIIRQGFLSLPRRVTPLLLGETDEKILQNILTEEVHDCLNELSRLFDDQSNALQEDVI